MKDGIYSLRFSADGYEGNGTFDLQENRGHGHDGKFKLEGHLIKNGSKLTAIFNVLMTPTIVRNSRLPEHYSLNMSGTSTEDTFRLIGTGPLGVIVDIDCRWSRPLDDERHFA